MAWKHGKTFWAHVRLQDGSRTRCSLGTNDRTTARDIERMLGILHGRREWNLIEAAVHGPLTIGTVYDSWRHGEDGLADLKRRISDEDLNLHIQAWKQWAERNAQRETVARYERQLRVLIPGTTPFLRSRFTRKGISDALRMVPGSSTTARRHHAAWSSFANYLVEADVIESNPLRSIRAPRPNPPKEVYLGLPDVLRLIEAQPEPYRTIAAVREGAGVEVSATLRLRRADVDLKGGVIQVHGTKTVWRNRPVRLDDWALPYMKRYITERALTPAAPLFEGIKQRTVWEVHRRAVATLGLDRRYTLHDARHSFAVRWMKAREDPVLIANNLGHKDATLVLRIYGKYRPTLQDLERARVRDVR